MNTKRFYTILVVVAILAMSLSACSNNTPAKYDIPAGEMAACQAIKGADVAAWYNADTLSAADTFTLANNSCYLAWKVTTNGGEIVVK